MSCRYPVIRSCCCDPPILRAPEPPDFHPAEAKHPSFSPLRLYHTVHFPMTNQSSGRDNLPFSLESVRQSRQRSFFRLFPLGLVHRGGRRFHSSSPPERWNASWEEGLTTRLGVCLFGEGDLHACGAVA